MGARISWRGYASIMALVRNDAMTAAAIGESLSVGLATMRLILRRMADQRLLYVAGWTETALHVVPSPMYRAGSLCSVPAPKTFRGKQSRHQAATAARLKPRTEMVAFALMVHRLKTCPHTRQELAESAGTHVDNVSKLLHHMKALRLVYVARWRPGRAGPPSECFAFGDRPDAQKPGPRTARRRIDPWRTACANSSVFHQVANA